MGKHNVPVGMKPWKTLKGILVHPKGKQDKEDTTECVYKVPCANCEKTYIGETWRKLGVRLNKHRIEFSMNLISNFCLQCFDAVGWAAGTASGL